MRIGILSDIHGNIDALRAVLNAASNTSIDRLFLLGDLVGYYYHPSLCLDILQEWDAVWISGNHEFMLKQARANSEARKCIQSKYGSGIELALNTLSDDRLDWLSNLPETVSVELDGKSALLCHGSPWCQDEYIYPDASATTMKKISGRGFDFVFMGHTHHPHIWDREGCHIANPGSVGQPRNRQPGAQWLIWDTEDDQLIPRNESYDMAAIISECKRRDPNHWYLHNVLIRTSG